MSTEQFWLSVGFVGQAFFSMRFLNQWIASEKRKESVIPISFWFFSIGGATGLLPRQDERFDERGGVGAERVRAEDAAAFVADEFEEAVGRAVDDGAIIHRVVAYRTAAKERGRLVRRRLREVPVRWNHHEGSKVHIVRDSLRMFSEVVSLRTRAARLTQRANSAAEMSL